MSRSKARREIRKFFIGLILIIGVFVYTNYLQEPINELLEKLDPNYKEEEDIKSRKLDDDLYVEYLDVGQADSILIYNKGHYMLIDAGNNEDGYKLVNYFKSMGITKFDYVVGTHAHEDHIGGMDDIINNFDIDHFYMPDVITTTKTFEDIVVGLENKQLAFETPKVDSTFKLGDASIKTLYVGNEEADLNNTSIVLKLTYGSNKFLFTGDAEGKVEKQILESGIESDVLKVGHHGSQYSSTLAFLKAVNPTYAVIQVGKNNVYDHPKKVILNRFDYLNIKIYRTDLDGTIVAKSDGEKITFSTKETDTNG
ncbi:MAG: ComEC/Rec2 family competence protein [Bacilli bacterium]|nr:ComEC/Rec2 family competence protein [Bacilli bacterium]